MKTFEEWYQYVLSFYGKGGLYDMGANKRQVAEATDILLKRIGWSFVADSVDREEVRDILIERYKLTFPTPPREG
jgi:hypothetical protein